MIQWVYEGVCQSKLIDEVIIATDDKRILEVVQKFGAKGVMTSSTHPTGTDRVAEVAQTLRSNIIVNVQGDEPLIKGRIIDKAIEPLIKDKTLMMSSLMTRIKDIKDWVNPNQGKVVVDRKGFALYFSRAPIPFPRDYSFDQILSNPKLKERFLSQKIYKTIGLYVYRRNFLLKLARMKPTLLENIEKLEQLRVIENGYKIKLIYVDYEPIGVDTPEDLKRVIAHLKDIHP